MDIFAFKATNSDASNRAVPTMTPLGAALRMPIHAPFPSDRPQDMANFILTTPGYEGKMVLVCWDHSFMRDLVEALGAPRPPAYPGDRFDLIYKVTYTDPAHPTFCIALQNLMFDDSDIPPAGFTLCP